MESALRSFRTIEPAGSYPVHSLHLSQSGSHLLLANGSNQARVYDREGRLLYECAKGDMYIADMVEGARRGADGARRGGGGRLMRARWRRRTRRAMWRPCRRPAGIRRCRACF